MKKTLLIVVVLILGVLFFAFHNHKDASKKLRIGASPAPHAEILELVKEELEKSGVTLEIIEFTDYVAPNIALSEGQIDANFFQHAPYLENFARERGLDLVSLTAIHIEPMGLYSEKIKGVAELREGAVVAIPNDPVNEGRALLLMQANGLIKLRPEAGLECVPSDIYGNPKKLEFKELEAAQLPRALADVDAAVINGNYAVEAKLNPTKDALLLENADSPYANIIAVRKEAKDDPRFQKLVKALKTDKIKNRILQKYQGGVVPAF
ncbi:MAG: MetQ/NlpA family ABC transporter substrate-binding protein [Holosporaceae bacterium]|jgi:D-methionine transport system substrate-binding protein|nr:MetQ/NlpA family ABC transporter substrate-binding protein [Holosporaceae bacterium]